MENLLVSSDFKYFIVPLFTVFFTVFLRVVSRKDQHTAFKKEDLAVGLQIAVTALIIYITYSVTMAEKIIVLLSKEGSTPELISILKTRYMMMPYILTAFFLGLWGMSTLVRKFGWKDEDNLNIGFGIVIPFVYGMFCLFFVVNWIR